MIFDVNSGRDIMAQYVDGTEVFAICPDGFIRTTTGWAYRQAGIGIGDVAADNDDYTYPILVAKDDITIVSAHIACDSTVVANATNYQTIYLEQSGNTNDISSLTTASSGFTLHVPREFTIGSTYSQQKLAAGDSLQLRIAQSGSGVIMYGVTVEVCYTIDQPKSTIGTSTDNIIRVNNDVGTGAVIKFDHFNRPFLSVRENGTERLKIDISGKMSGTTADQYYYQVINTGQLVTGDSATKISPLFAPHCTVQIERVWMGASSTHAVDSNTNYWQIKITDATDILVDHNVFGPYGGATSLTKGEFIDMGDVNEVPGRITSSEKICAEYLEAGTGPNIDGLTFVICYRKLD